MKKQKIQILILLVLCIVCVGGYFIIRNHTFEREEETVSVDMEKVDFKKLQGVMGTQFSGDPSNGISMKQSQKMLETAGFKEVK